MLRRSDDDEMISRESATGVYSLEREREREREREIKCITTREDDERIERERERKVLGPLELCDDDAKQSRERVYSVLLRDE